LYYNYHRYYGPEIGRYLTADPIGLDGGVNLYAYVNNPVNWVDPDGLAPERPPIFDPKNPPEPPPGRGTIQPPQRRQPKIPKGPGTGCNAIFKVCMKGCEKAGKFCGKKVQIGCSGVCLALYFGCNAVQYLQGN
jgi:hypothetical protein